MRDPNLMHSRQTPDLSLEVDEPDLEEKLLQVLRRIVRDEEELRSGILGVVPHQIQMMGEMGMVFRKEVERVYPDLELPELKNTWESHLPPLSPHLRQLMEAR